MVYIHIPFCRSFCTYCGFYSEICKDEARLRLFASVLCREIHLRKEELEAATGVTDTVYVGGGTPSVLPLDCLEEITGTLRQYVPFPDDAERTIELNPEDVVRRGPSYAAALRSMGFNRASLGIQSFDDGILKWMNRRHDSSCAVQAVEILRGEGFDNISIDLIFGISRLGGDLWRETVTKALSLPSGKPEHISAYQLSIESGSALERLVLTGRYTEASAESCAAQYDLLCSILRENGYHHYEVSNFALPGREAVHNSAYWSRQAYVGLGPGAHSFDGARLRSWNSDDLEGYLAGSFPGGSETLSDEDLRTERLMLSLRTSRGMKESELRELCDGPVIDRLSSCGSLSLFTGANQGGQKESRIRIPESCWFISDNIVSELV